ncbi:DUF7482 domain-containing protein [Candidatus Nitrosocosmicus arcticus]|uniref:Periplasmic protein of plastocyanin/azurin family protein n=1 Tax=Candidatus Nitrosocosmicus arcticus TaxID=2035267 RepID=A0A557SWT3_9ARCH|nr:hypothetical protein [Candidatus Nitrosocosmicus arcticus]TVP41068.1 Periplasmic protein of plastocyanin/azurin family protein [Candidatus Nitrosocosmicus arcticus]
MKQTITYNKSILAIVIAMSIVITLLSSGVAHGQNSNLSQNEPLKSIANETGGSNDSIIISIPVEKGYVNGNISYFISTDASQEMIVSSITNTTKFDVNYAPTLSNTPELSRQQGFVFTNGLLGNGTFEHQLPVASAASGDEGYSPLFQINYVKWNNESQPRILKSTADIMDAQSQGELTVEKSNVVINSPAVMIK